MYKEVLRSIENIEIYPIISLLIFVLFFVAMLLWVIKVPKSYIDHMRSLPMEEDDIIKKEP
ncbi:cbb3-type cytochrome c oxidase subunit 3 [Algoriphagus lutimaris]|uniref:cbb3-type cytochrome c oxidase subunit 3 n=1 Tax=Algoriphagus lutimaris TaxID=613197 RepID=UPI00196B3B94|nr:cbb3-type cytochrome c oxidase subunit 3 [Algoriphagus lutimaris]MBN3518372.1 cbb3-type cytochrome c oxidase subunit 3 [Algoriphagus lutimaris]